MRLVAGRHLQCGRLHLDEVPLVEPSARRSLDGVAHDQPRAAIGMDMRRPPGRGGGHERVLTKAAPVRLAVFAEMG